MIVGYPSNPPNSQNPSNPPNPLNLSNPLNPPSPSHPPNPCPHPPNPRFKDSPEYVTGFGFWLVIYPMSGNNATLKTDFTHPRKRNFVRDLFYILDAGSEMI